MEVHNTSQGGHTMSDTHKVVRRPQIAEESIEEIEKFLNDMAKDGWVLHATAYGESASHHRYGETFYIFWSSFRKETQ